LYEFQKERRLQIHIIQNMLDDLCYGDYEAASALAEYAIRHTATELYSHPFGSISGEMDFGVIFSNMGQNNDWLRKRFREHLSEACFIYAEVGYGFEDGSEKVIHMPQLDKGAKPYSFLFLVEGDACELGEKMCELWFRERS